MNHQKLAHYPLVDLKPTIFEWLRNILHVVAGEQTTLLPPFFAGDGRTQCGIGFSLNSLLGSAWMLSTDSHCWIWSNWALMLVMKGIPIYKITAFPFSMHISRPGLSLLFFMYKETVLRFRLGRNILQLSQPICILWSSFSTSLQHFSLTHNLRNRSPE